MANINKLTGNLKQAQIYASLISKGLSPEEIKGLVIDEFSVLVKDVKVLESDAMNYLLSDTIILVRLRMEYSKYYNMLIDINETLNEAIRYDNEKFVDSFVYWLEKSNESKQKYWATYNLFIEHQDLEFEEIATQTFSAIKNIIEGLIKPYLMHLYKQVKMINDVEVEDVRVQNEKIGNMVDYLINKLNIEDLLILKPNDVRLNQWRNIAAHESYAVNNNKVDCEYDSRNGKITFSITKEELTEVFFQIKRIYEVLKLSFTSCFLNNKKIISDRKPDIKARTEDYILMFFNGLNSQGFEIRSFNYDENNAFLKVRDILLGSDVKMRRAHCSQYLMFLWIITRSKNVEIEYYDVKNQKDTSFSISDEICKHVYENNLDANIIAEKMLIKVHQQ